ncbi:MAG: hypothetical protein SFZ23_08685 [Planctomycetota bacterium]|nr:hypothetical protein [Planctomycetota bacterium]
MPSTLSISELYDAVEQSDKLLTYARQMRVQAIQAYATRYGYRDDNVARPHNGTRLFVRTLATHLHASLPDYDVQSDDPAIRGEAKLYSILLRRLAEEIGLARTIKLAIKDALLGPFAVIQLGIRAGAESVLVQHRGANLGQLYARRKSLDDYCYDPDADDRLEMRWEGIRYAVPRATLADAGVNTDSIPSLGDQPGRGPLDGASSVSRGQQRRGANAAPGVELVQLLDVVYFDSDGRASFVQTLPATRDSGMGVISEREYAGPERGPFEILEFDPLPDQAVGVSPVSGQREQEEDLNAVMTKAANQARRLRNVLVTSRLMSDQDQAAVQTAEDGTHIVVEDPDDAQTRELGAISPELPALADMFRRQWDEAGGAIGTLSGTHSRVRTARQHMDLQAQAGVPVDDMAETLEDCHSRIGQHMLWHIMHHPGLTRRMSYKLPGSDVPYELVYSDEDREGDYLDFRVKVVGRSTLRQDPAITGAQLAEIADLTLRWVQVEAQTGMVDTRGMLRVLGSQFPRIKLADLVRDPETLAAAQLGSQLAGPPPSQAPARRPADLQATAGYGLRPLPSGTRGTRVLGVGA